MRALRWLLVATVALVLVAVAVAVTAIATTRADGPDAFYRPPDPLPSTAPGDVLRVEPVTRGIPDGADAWRVLYVSTTPTGEPVAVSALVVAGRAASQGARPVLAWAHGTSGVVPRCAPSLARRPLFGIPALAEVLAEGWVLVATDYPGLGTPGQHPYLVGESEGRSVLDAVRAAHRLEVGLGLDERYAVWGHSQGGHAALFAGQLADDYAPELDLVGVAAIAPATDLAETIAAMQGTLGGKLITSLAAYAWSRTYPGITFEDAIVDRAERVGRTVATSCLVASEAALAALAARLLPGDLLELDPLTDPRWRPLLDLNSADAPVDAPLLVVQGTADEVIRQSITEANVARRCRRGDVVDYRSAPGATHFTVLDPAGEAALPWTRDRLAGAPATRACPG